MFHDAKRTSLALQRPPIWFYIGAHVTSAHVMQSNRFVLADLIELIVSSVDASEVGKEYLFGWTPAQSEGRLEIEYLLPTN
jgi:hypothetical protein